MASEGSHEARLREFELLLGAVMSCACSLGGCVGLLERSEGRLKVPQCNLARVDGAFELDK